MLCDFCGKAVVMMETDATTRVGSVTMRGKKAEVCIQVIAHEDSLMAATCNECIEAAMRCFLGGDKKPKKTTKKKG
jgi:hypothetical protein